MTLQRELAKAGFGGRVVDRDAVDFHAARRTWNGLVDRSPLLIAQPRDPADIAAAVRVAIDQGLPLAVRGGGHSIPGLSTCDGGVVVDLCGMRDVLVDPATRSASVGGGALLGDLDAAAAGYGLAVPAGVVSHTGVAGLTLGGGMGWLSRRWGMTVDNLIEAEVVTAGGEVLVASEQHDPDLLWAIRGGGGNFGVVSRFTFTLHPLDGVVVGAWAYPLTVLRELLPAYGAASADNPRELTTALTVTADAVEISAIWSGDAARAERAVQHLDRLGAARRKSLVRMPFPALQSRSDEDFAWGRRYYATGGYFGSLTAEIADAVSTASAGLPTSASLVDVLQLGGAVGDVAEDATAFTGREAQHFWLVEAVWDEPADDERCMSWARSAGRALDVHALAGNYVNEQSEVGSAMVSSSYGGEKLQRLRALKRRYDVDNVFRLNQNIRPDP